MKSSSTTVSGAAPGEQGPRSAYTPATERADRRWHRALRIGLALALLIHAALLLSVQRVQLPPSSLSAAGPQMGDYRAAEGGSGGLEMVQFRVQQERATVAEVVPEPVPVPDVEVVIEPTPQPEPTPEPARLPEVALAPGLSAPGTGGREGEGTGPGLADGAGRGGGGTEAEGSSGLIAPRPRGLFLPPQGVPAEAKGREIIVYVFVNAQGRVLGDSTRIHPPTRDTRFNRRLRDQAAEWIFDPARRGGQPVAAWFEYGLTL